MTGIDLEIRWRLDRNDDEVCTIRRGARQMLKLDPEIAAAFAALARAAVDRPPPAPGDLAGLRETTNAGLAGVFARVPPAPSVRLRQQEIATADGATISLRVYDRPADATGAAVLYAHGGGMICGSVAIYDPWVRQYVEHSGVTFVSVGYRLAPEHRDQGLADDMVAALIWLQNQASAVGIDPGRIAVMGDSGGGGVAAAAAIMARDRGIALAQQILIYPMLDDRNLAPDPRLLSTATWNYDKNRTAWSAILGEALGSEAVSPYRAPARLRDFTGLAPAYIEVGELDIFRDESIVYAQRLHAAGVSCALHVLAGAPHGHDWIDMETSLSRRCVEERVRLLRTL